jgi:hypothetical protein
LLAPPIVLSAVAQDRIIGVASVIDGDSIEIHGQRNERNEFPPPAEDKIKLIARAIEQDADQFVAYRRCTRPKRR